MITDVNTIKQLAKLKEKENISFFNSVRRRVPSQKFDDLVSYWGNFYAQNIDCKKCANCCKVLNPSFSNEDIKRYENILSSEMKEKLIPNLYIDPLEDRFVTKCNPCPLLHNNLCLIYETRPASCSNFPYLNNSNQKYRTRTLMANYEVCPIVFNTIEKLKETLADI